MDIALSSTGTILVAGSVTATNLQLDYLNPFSTTAASLIVGELDVPPMGDVTDDTNPTEATIVESQSYLIPVVLVLTVVVGSIYCCCWKGRKAKNFRSRGKSKYSRVNDFEMDHVEDVTVFAIDEEDGRR